MPLCAVDEFTLQYETFGSDTAPPLVIVHGLYGEASTVRFLAERFSATFHVIVPDALGHGRSSHPAAFTLADQGRALDGLVAALGYDSAALLGISMGSYIVAQAAAAQPARVSRLILVVSKAHGTTSSTAAYAARNGFDLSAATPEQLVAFMSGALWSPDTSSERRAELIAAQTVEVPLTAAEQAAIERSLQDFDLRPALPDIVAPTLVISGTADGLNPPEAGREVAEHIPGARFVVYEHSGHMLASEETDRLVADATAFIVSSAL